MAETPHEKAEAARVRRRWLNVGEIVAIAAVAISGLTFWNSYRERTDAESARVAGEHSSSRAAATLILKASPQDDGRTLALAPRQDAQSIQSQTIRFPGALKLTPVETTGEARIERGWFDSALVDARRAAGAKGDTVGDAQLPVLIETRFLVGGEAHVDRAIYEIGYAADHGFLTGTSVRLHGLSRIGAAAGGDKAGQARIDAMWRPR